jgi:type IV secretory pathway TrbF-like protein
MATKGTPLNKALSMWEEKYGQSYAEATEIKLIFCVIVNSFSNLH